MKHSQLIFNIRNLLFRSPDRRDPSHRRRLLATAVKWTAMDNSPTDPSPSVPTEGGMSEAGRRSGRGGVVGAQMETLQVRETQPAHKAVLAVTESDGHFPPLYRRRPFLPSSLLKCCTFPGVAVKRNTTNPPPLLLDFYRMIHWSRYRIGLHDGHSREKLNLN